MKFLEPINLDPSTKEARIGNMKYCEFHRDYGHVTNNCRELGTFLETQAKNENLREYIAIVQENPNKDTNLLGAKESERAQEAQITSPMITIHVHDMI